MLDIQIKQILLTGIFELEAAHVVDNLDVNIPGRLSVDAAPHLRV